MTPEQANDDAWFAQGKRVHITSTIKGMSPSQKGTRGKLGTVRSDLSCMGWVYVQVDGREDWIEYALDQIEPAEEDKPHGE